MKPACSWGRPALLPQGVDRTTPHTWNTVRCRCIEEPSSIRFPVGLTHSSAFRSRRMAKVEAALIVSPEALPPRKLMQVAMLSDPAEVAATIAELNQAFDQTRSPFRIERVASGFRLFTRSAYALWLGKLHQRQMESKLSSTVLETLTVIAYRQPLTRADLESIRGAQCTEILKQLMDRGLVRIAGEEESLGRPFLYATTRGFLEMFGLKNLDDLPGADQLRKPKSTTRPESAPAEEAA